MKELTRAEEQIMQVLWQLKKGYVREVIKQLPKPKPAYNTVSTIIRILEKKGFVSHVVYGKTHLYYPVVDKKKYTRDFMKSFVKKYFSDSYGNMVSFFAKEEKINITELEEVKQLIEDKIADKKKKE